MKKKPQIETLSFSRVQSQLSQSIQNSQNLTSLNSTQRPPPIMFMNLKMPIKVQKAIRTIRSYSNSNEQKIIEGPSFFGLEISNLSGKVQKNDNSLGDFEFRVRPPTLNRFRINSQAESFDIPNPKHQHQFSIGEQLQKSFRLPDIRFELRHKTIQRNSDFSYLFRNKLIE